MSALLGRSGGVTVLLVPAGTTAAVDHRGDVLASRETNLLEPENLVQRIDALCLAGGGSFGLAAADGVVRWLSERGRGFQVGALPHEVVPIVPIAAVPSDERPDASAGYAACAVAADFTGPSELVDGFSLGAFGISGDARTAGVVFVDAVLSKAECRRLAVSAQDGRIRAVRGSGAVFAAATGERPLPDGLARAFVLDSLCAAAARLLERALTR